MPPITILEQNQNCCLSFFDFRSSFEKSKPPFLFIFDKTTARVDPCDPAGAFCQVLIRLRELLHSGVDGINKSDYFDEFTAYWSYNSSFKGIFFSCANVSDEFKELVVAPSDIPKGWLIADSKEAAERYVGSSLDDAMIKACIYVPLDQELRYPFPDGRAEWIDVISSSCPCGNQLRSALRKAGRNPLVVLFSQPAKNGRVLAALVFNFEAFNSKAALQKGLFELRYLDDEMTDSEFNAKLRSLSRTIKPGQLARAHVEDLRGSRLLNRGGVGRMLDFDSVLMLGCGSLGSVAADAFARLGVKSLTLVDNDFIMPENVARHICGLDNVMINKAVATRNRIRLLAPWCECVPQAQDIHLYLDSLTDSSPKPGLVVVATGSLSTELHAFKIWRDLYPDTPIMAIWMEPYGVAAHALLLNSPTALDKLALNDNAEFDGGIVINANELSKRESGCASTFVPYAGSDVLIFVNTLLSVIPNCINSCDGYRFDWFGKLSVSHNYPVLLRDGALEHHDYSFEIVRL